MSAVLSESEITAANAYAFARQHGLERWFDTNVIHPRTRKGRANTPLKQREADRFQRLQLLVARTREAFASEDKAMFWLKRGSSVFNGLTPLENARWEKGFLAVLDHLTRIEHGIYA